MCAGTAWIYLRSELSGQLMRTGLDHASHLLWEEIDGKHGAMTLCGLNSQQNHLGSAAQDFARRAALGFFLLWLLGLLLSFWHALRQKRVAQNFHRRHPSLAEFALNLEGFPASATDEEQILQFVRQAFGLEDVQVSVCYDYRDRRERVRELWEKVLVDEDVAAGAYHPNLAGSVIGRRGLGLSEEERDEVRRWLDRSKPGGLKNAGSVFVIFSHNYDLHTAERQFPEPTAMQRLTRGKTPLLPHSLTPEFLLSPLHWVAWVDDGDGRQRNRAKGVDDEGQMHRLTVRDVACEPPEVAWEHLGLDVASVSVRAALAGVAVLVSRLADPGGFGVIAAVVFLPLATYNISYVSQAGSLPTGVMMSVMGILVMTVNWMIGLLHIFVWGPKLGKSTQDTRMLHGHEVSSKVGFTRRDREGLLIFKAHGTAWGGGMVAGRGGGGGENGGKDGMMKSKMR
ncbi:Hypothetical protein SCF082_LOCUS23558 [Durusdinium trenchii]|uniref:Uncharacterized protein n=1 Tax=Durusdinium trenchii TaxID=1381693 RepID=A0ABP0LN06_9DINO